jgi:hypothetical protein
MAVGPVPTVVVVIVGIGSDRIGLCFECTDVDHAAKR